MLSNKHKSSSFLPKIGSNHTHVVFLERNDSSCAWSVLSRPHKYSTRVASGVLNQESFINGSGVCGEGTSTSVIRPWPSKSPRVIFYPHDAPPPCPCAARVS